MTSILETRDLDVAIAGKQVCADLNLEIAAGQRWAILGKNGIGKTTLLHTLAGLQPSQNGVIYLNGKKIDTIPRKRVAQSLGILFQDHEDPFPSTVLETALTGRHPYLGALEWESARDIEMTREILSQLDLAGMENRLVNTLSGGERRRLGLATLLVQDPGCMLLDEPTNHLDLPHQIAILNRLQQMTMDHEKAIMMILHDVNLASRFCTHMLLLYGNGEIIHGKKDDVLSNAALERLFDYPMLQITGDNGRKVWLPR